MILSAEFPLSLETDWIAPQSIRVPDFHLRNWLLDTGSLTERLQSHCRQFRVQLLGQAPLPLLDNEREQMGPVDYLVREVILWGDDRPWVFARSLLPRALCEQDRGELSNLGEKPLGSILFNDARFERQPFQVTRLSAAHRLQSALKLPGTQVLWGRRSVFHYLQWRMMVAEVFLPQCPAYKQMGAPHAG
ncbi:chorismate lyase [Bowmanella dokdonensis]|uniref:Probable chorismate pyruvate-lyase n=1 Tax=Bowmanella dokdonensis TaxID=751969 RepID=A0A939IMA9_9ALTE|nr:chorismate lyase [Bowmanella dokdonensis]